MKKRTKTKKKRKSIPKILKRKKKAWLYSILSALIIVVFILIFIVWSKKNQNSKKEEFSNPDKNEKKTSTSNEKYFSLANLGEQLKGKIITNSPEYLILEEVFPTKRKIKIESEDFKILKLNKVVPKSNFSAAKMEEIQNEVKSTREKKADQLAKDNPDEEKIVSYNEEITKLLDEKIFELVEVKEASIEDFTVDSEITFSRLKNDDLQLTVYPAEVKIYFPE